MTWKKIIASFNSSNNANACMAPLALVRQGIFMENEKQHECLEF